MDIPPCPSSPDGKHWPNWREWRVAEREGRPIPCEHCGVTVWPVCSTCDLPRIGWDRHDWQYHDRHRRGASDAL